MEIAQNFGAVLDTVFLDKRYEEIMQTGADDVEALPGLFRPVWWEVPHVGERDLGIYITSRMLSKARAYASWVWGKDFRRLRLYDQALTIFYAPDADIAAPAREAAEDYHRRDMVWQDILSIISRINSAAIKDGPMDMVESLVSELNSVLGRRENKKAPDWGYRGT